MKFKKSKAFRIHLDPRGEWRVRISTMMPLLVTTMTPLAASTCHCAHSDGDINSVGTIVGIAILSLFSILFVAYLLAGMYVLIIEGRNPLDLTSWNGIMEVGCCSGTVLVIAGLFSLPGIFLVEDGVSGDHSTALILGCVNLCCTGLPLLVFMLAVLFKSVRLRLAVYQNKARVHQALAYYTQAGNQLRVHCQAPRASKQCAPPGVANSNGSCVGPPACVHQPEDIYV